MTKPERGCFSPHDVDLILRKILKEKNIQTIEVAKWGLIAYKELIFFIQQDKEILASLLQYIEEAPKETQLTFFRIGTITDEMVDHMRNLQERYIQDSIDISETE